MAISDQESYQNRETLKRELYNFRSTPSCLNLFSQHIIPSSGFFLTNRKSACGFQAFESVRNTPRGGAGGAGGDSGIVRV